ncbi:MAG: hypothetical protein ABI716_02065 [Candidatus Saccharibacteria bacterium]
MSSTTKFMALCLIIAALVSSELMSAASALTTPMTEEQIGRIRVSCLSAKSSLNRLHATDALLRVNRGQIYESMSTKLMTQFNSRVTRNHFDAKDLTSVTESYGAALTDFRADYMKYEVQLANTLNIDCSKEPVSFYDAVAVARINRAQVHADVVKLHQSIDDYSAAFNTFSTTFDKINGVKQ